MKQLTKSQSVTSCNVCPLGDVYRHDDMDWCDSVSCLLLPGRSTLMTDPPDRCPLRKQPISITFSLKLAP